MEWARILAYITGTVDRELLLRNEYLVAENRILKSLLKGRLKLSDVERTKLGEIGHRLGRKALGEVAATALPDTILAWYRRLIARKFDGSQARRAPGRPRIDREVEQLIVRMAEENRLHRKMTGSYARALNRRVCWEHATGMRPNARALNDQRGSGTSGTWTKQTETPSDFAAPYCS